jgi:hypothetical protein
MLNSTSDQVQPASAVPVSEMAAMTVLTVIPADKDAAEIGDLYRKTQLSLVESIQFAFACGQRLIEKKASLPHGAWLRPKL